MGENLTKIEDLYIKDLKSGEVYKVGDLKTIEFQTTSAPEAHELVSEADGVHIHISGSQIDKIDNIEIYFKEG